MRLRTLASAVPGARLLGDADVEIAALTHDSREATSGSLFCAIRGERFDGHAFVGDALRRGAAALAVEHAVAAPAPQVVVPEARQALPRLAAAFYRDPSRDLDVIGVTGTNGKGAVTHLVEAILSGAGMACGIIGTLGARIGGETVHLVRTTPEAPQFQALLRHMADAGMRAAAVEVASHALAQYRVDATRFRAAVFTNLTQDHLDFHGTFDGYRAAKQRLFEMLEPDGVAVVNRDDPYGAEMAARSRAPEVSYGLGARADVRAEDVALDLEGSRFVAVTPRGRLALRLPLVGAFNVMNALAAIAVAHSLGLDLDAARVLEEFRGVPGRFERVDEGQPFAVIVDYAHTPDGLENVLRAASFAPGRTIVVFGCGGDRDRTKRPIMGRIATQLADWAIVTSDNPRTEDPGAIVREVVAGITRRNFEVEVDRRAAIARAIGMARAGDLVLIAGKGHEEYQDLGARTIHFDDREEARAALRALGVTDRADG